MRSQTDRQTVIAMHQAGQSSREIARVMKMSRKTIRRILAGHAPEQANRPSRYEALAPLVCQLYRQFAGNCVSIQNELARHYGHSIPYTSLTHLVRTLNLRPEKTRRSGTFDWTLESFPFNKQPAVNKKQIMDLAQLDFIANAHNVVFIGEPGTGKTGLAIGLLRKALIAGYRGRFYNAQDLLDQLYSSLADRSTNRLINTLCRYDILVIDELGYLTLKSEQVNAFFKLMGERYQRKTTIITTNLIYEKWYDLFASKAMVDALLDRLKHRCVTIEINGKSLRTPIPPKNK